MEFMMSSEFQLIDKYPSRLSARLVANDRTCLGLNAGGCTGIRLQASQNPEASRIATQTYTDVVSELKREFPWWDPFFTQGQTGPTLSLDLDILRVYAKFSGQFRAQPEIAGVALTFLGYVDVVAELSPSRMFFAVEFKLGIISGDVKFDINLPPADFKAIAELNMQLDWMSIISLSSFVKDLFSYAKLKIKSGGGLKLDTSGGLTLKADVLGIKTSLTVGGRRLSGDLVQEILQEYNLTNLAALENFSFEDMPLEQLLALQEKLERVMASHGHPEVNQSLVETSLEGELENVEAIEEVVEYPFEFQLREETDRQGSELERRLSSASMTRLLDDFIKQPTKLAKELASYLNDAICSIPGIGTICDAFKAWKAIKDTAKKVGNTLKKVFR
eukprot:TRINITY_DN82020_c0_g1_i1.p1 TRINITY_DN82020_c0_g1~~TRINITY_DN82020_c0_g1_i1.p1  ORF type:complete len:402 (-),score=62.20 TRINITY_DN82020_c0_g1_i1:173-1339(-)